MKTWTRCCARSVHGRTTHGVSFICGRRTRLGLDGTGNSDGQSVAVILLEDLSSGAGAVCQVRRVSGLVRSLPGDDAAHPRFGGIADLGSPCRGARVCRGQGSGQLVEFCRLGERRSNPPPAERVPGSGEDGAPPVPQTCSVSQAASPELVRIDDGRLMRQGAGPGSRRRARTPAAQPARQARSSLAVLPGMNTTVMSARAATPAAQTPGAASTAIMRELGDIGLVAG